MAELVTDRGVLIGLAVATLAVIGAWLFQRLLGRRMPFEPLVLLSISVSLPGADVRSRAYRSLPTITPTWATALIVVAVAAVIAVFIRFRSEPVARSRSTLVLALASAGIFACVPETDSLRLLFGPMVLLAVASFVGWIHPLHPVGAGSAASVLGWIALVDGSARTASIIGAASCLLVVAVVAPVTTDSIGIDRGLRWRWPRHGSIPLAFVLIAMCSRLAGVSASPSTAAVIAGVTLMAGLLVALAVPSSRSVAALDRARYDSEVR